jgi:hypothetical protein
MNEKVRIGDRYYFSLVAKIILTFVVLAIYYFIYSLKDELIFIVLGILVSPIIPAIWMSRYVTEINKDYGYTRFVWVLGKKIKTKKISGKLESVELKNIEKYPGLLGLYANISNAQPKCLITSYEFDSIEKKANLIKEKLKIPYKKTL